MSTAALWTTGADELYLGPGWMLGRALRVPRFGPGLLVPLAHIIGGLGDAVLGRRDRAAAAFDRARPTMDDEIEARRLSPRTVEKHVERLRARPGRLDAPSSWP